MTTNIVTYFKTQFPNGDVTETCNDVVFDEEHDRYCKFNLDIGWAMKGGHSNRRADKNGDRVRKYDRICCGYFTCENENCKVYNLPRRPPTRKKAVCKELNEGCKSCSGTLAHKPCPARVVYIFSKKGCTMTHINMHRMANIVENIYLWNRIMQWIIMWKRIRLCDQKQLLLALIQEPGPSLHPLGKSIQFLVIVREPDMKQEKPRNA